MLKNLWTMAGSHGSGAEWIVSVVLCMTLCDMLCEFNHADNFPI